MAYKYNKPPKMLLYVFPTAGAENLIRLFGVQYLPKGYKIVMKSESFFTIGLWVYDNF